MNFEIVNNRIDTYNQDREAVDSQLNFITCKIGEDFINIKYPPAPLVGCVGDGNADDTEAFQEILNNYCDIYIPSGDYIISKPLNISSGTHIISSNWSNIRKNFTIEDNQPWLFYSEGGFSNIIIDGLNLHLNDLDSDENACGIKFEGMNNNISIINCTFNRCSGAVYFKSPYEDINRSSNIRIENNIVNTVTSPTSPIFLVENSDNVTINGNKSDKGKGQAYLYHCVNSRIKDNIFLGTDNYWGETQHLGAIELYSGCDNIDIEGNIVQSVDVLDVACITAIRSKNNTNVNIRNNMILWNNDSEYAIDIRRDDTSAINTSDHIISDNIIKGTSTCGIVLKSLVEGGEINNIKIRNNIMLGKVIELFGTSTVTDSSYNDVDIIDNQCRSIFSFKFANNNLRVIGNTASRTSNTAAIAVQYATESVIMGNKVIGDGVTLSNGIDYRYTTDLLVGNNIFKNVTNSYITTGALSVTDLSSLDKKYVN